MVAGADVYKPVTDVLHGWISIPEYLHKMFKSMHMKVIVIEINAFSKNSHINCLFWDIEGIRFSNEISMCCYVCYMLKYALKSAVNLFIWTPF